MSARSIARAVGALAVLWTCHSQALGTLEQAISAYEAGNYGAAHSLFSELAWQGNVEAQYSLGVMYHTGAGRPRDDEEAVRWFRRAAAQDHLDAMFNLGIAYWEGAGVDQNVSKAVHWWRRAAELGLPEAQYNLGTVYYLGKGTPRDYPLAIAWFKRAAQNGHSQAREAFVRLTDQYPHLLPRNGGNTATGPAEGSARPPAARSLRVAPPRALDGPAQVVSVHAFAASSAPVIGRLDANRPLEVLQRTKDWALVKVPDGVNVWVFGQYVDQDGEVGRIAAAGVRARPFPSTDQDSVPLGVFQKDDVVEVTGRRNDWLRVRVVGRIPGWVRVDDIPRLRPAPPHHAGSIDGGV